MGLVSSCYPVRAGNCDRPILTNYEKVFATAGQRPRSADKEKRERFYLFATGLDLSIMAR